jgi:sugar lactone lactonase YvrE
VQPFSANRPVSWNVVEAAGGTIDSDGKYTAPFSPGTFHVHAVATDAPTEEATATVDVGDHALTLVAGNFGVGGTADDRGSAARLSGPHHLAYDGTRYIYFGDGGAVRRLDVGTGDVVTLAGRVAYWTGNVDGVGAAAKLAQVYAVALDGNGGLYVTDIDNNTVRKVDLATRAVTTVAGQPGVTGTTDGNGTAALFQYPAGLVCDTAAGKLYIGDSLNGLIRVFDLATGNVTTLVSGITSPDGLVLDGNGTLYATDAYARQVWSVDIASKTATRIAGSYRGVRDGVGTAAHFETIGPAALVGGALWIGDTLGLRKLDLSTKQVTTVRFAGGLRSAIGLVPVGNDFVASIESIHAIVRVHTDGTITPLAGPVDAGSGNVDGKGMAARFADPGNVVADGSGSLYVSDVTNGEVRKVDLTAGDVTTFVGTAWNDGDRDGAGSTARLDGPLAFASDGAGTLFLVEQNGTVHKYVVATNAVTALAGTPGNSGVDDGVGPAARFSQPVGACWDGGALYVVDTGNDDVRKLDVVSGTVTRLAGSPEEPGASDGVGSAARFSSPAGIACDGAGYAYVADDGNDVIRRVKLADGTVDTIAGAFGQTGEVDMPGAAARFTYPQAIAFGGGFLYVLDNDVNNLHLRKLTLGSFAVQTIATSSIAQQQFTGVAVDGSGTVYVSDKQFGKSIVYSVAAGALAPFAGSAAGNGLTVDGVGTAASFFGAAGLLVDAGALWVAEPGANVVRKVDLASATVSSPLGRSPFSPNVAGTGTSAFVFAPAGLTVVGSDTLFVADAWTLDTVTLPGATLSIAAGAYGIYGGQDGVGTAARTVPSSVVYDGSGTLYFTGGNTVRRYVVSTGQVDTIAGVEGSNGYVDGNGSAARFYWPKGIALDGAGNLYVADTRNHVIRKVVIATHDVSTFAGANVCDAVDDVGAAARFCLPMGLVSDGKGALFVADSENGAVRRIDVASAAVSTYVGVLRQRGLAPGPLPARLNAPRGLALLPDGGLAITDEQAVLVAH